MLFCDFVAKNDMTVLYTKALVPTDFVKTPNRTVRLPKKKEKRTFQWILNPFVKNIKNATLD